MNQCWFRLKRFMIDDHGATMLEYGLMVALIAVVAVVAVTAFGLAVGDLFDAPMP